MSSRVPRYIAFLLTLLLLSCVSGTFATWVFEKTPPEPVAENLRLSLEAFDFSDISQEGTEEVNKALAQKFLKILNDATDYSTLTGAMDDNYDGSRDWTASYIGNVAGSSLEDTTILNDLFGGSLSLEVNGTNVEVTCIVKRENIDGDLNTGVSFSTGAETSTYYGCEMTLYLTTANFDRIAFNDYPPVYAMVFTKPSQDAQWVQIGEPMYAGTAQVVGYVGGSTTGSFNTSTWRSSETYHGVPAFATISKLIQAAAQ